MIQAHLANLEAALANDTGIQTYMLHCVNWNYIRSQIEAARTKAEGAGTGNNDTIRRVLSQHIGAGSGFLITEIQFLFKTLLLRRGRSPPVSSRVVVAASWPGYYDDDSDHLSGLPCRVFSDVVTLGSHDLHLANSESGEEGESYMLNAALVLPITHNNSRWNEMPPVRFVCYTVIDGQDEFASPEGHIPRLDDADIDVHGNSPESAAQERRAGLQVRAE
jgi:hypothetical protein